MSVRVVFHPAPENVRMMEMMVVVYGGERLTDKLKRLYLRCFEIRPRVVMYRWMRYFMPIAVGGPNEKNEVGVGRVTFFTDMKHLHTVARADSYGLLWAMTPNVIIFPIHVEAPKGTT